MESREKVQTRQRATTRRSVVADVVHTSHRPLANNYGTGLRQEHPPPGPPQGGQA